MAEKLTTCPFCNTQLSVDETYWGMEVTCPQCNKNFTPGSNAQENIPTPIAVAVPTPVAPPTPAVVPEPVAVSQGQVNPVPAYNNQYQQPPQNEAKTYCTNCGNEIASNAAICIKCGVMVGTEKNFCASCGKRVNANQAVCINCGCALTNKARKISFGGKTISSGEKSAKKATILSCLLVGLGQIYLGQVTKGIVIFVSGVILQILTLWAFGIGGVVIWIIAMIDANKIGKKIEAGQSVGEWEFF